MKLSSKDRYGLQALFHIAFHRAGSPTQIKEIADKQAIPPRFLEQIFQDLKRAGLVSSKRGPRGGYRLARPAVEIKLGDVIRALEGSISVCGARSNRGCGDATGRDIVDDTLEHISQQISDCFDALTIQDLCDKAEALCLNKRPSLQLRIRDMSTEEPSAEVAKVVPNPLHLIGDTPLVRISRIGSDKPRANIWAKAEHLNPGGSVKDRICLSMIEGC